MADPAKAKEAGGSADETTAKKKKPFKLIGLIAGLMVAEGAAVFLVAGSGGGPKDAKAEIGHGPESELEQLVEIPLVEEKFQNMQTGRVWVWDVEIVLQVKGRNQEHVAGTLAVRSAEIKEGLSGIFRRAQHSHLKEPDLTTLNRQVARYVNDLIGADHEGRPRVERVFIPKCKGFQSEY